MEESILYRLLLTRSFLDQARSNVLRQDDTSLALAVVNLHDAFDNLCGAIASHLGVHVPENTSLMKTYERVAAGRSQFTGKVRLEQLNSLRNAVKHHGLHPNPLVVRQIVPELSRLADEMAADVFQKPVSAVHAVDLIADEQVKRDLMFTLERIDAADYKNALENMALIMFRVYELAPLSQKRFARALLALRSSAASAGATYDFPEIEKTDRRLDFLELGLDPQEYEAFHRVVPRVGLAGASDTAYVMKKNRQTWHQENWTLANCERAVAFLIRLIVAQQKRKSEQVVSVRQPIDKVTFIKDSALYEDRIAQAIIAAVRSGDEVYALALPYVDGSWQNFGEDLVVGNFLHAGEWTIAYVKKSDVEVTPGVQIDAREA